MTVKATIKITAGAERLLTELEAYRNKILEEAALAAETLRHPDYSSETPDWCNGTDDAAAAIRKLKT